MLVWCIGSVFSSKEVRLSREFSLSFRSILATELYELHDKNKDFCASSQTFLRFSYRLYCISNDYRRELIVFLYLKTE